jgi:hypothetical protein
MITCASGRKLMESSKSDSKVKGLYIDGRTLMAFQLEIISCRSTAGNTVFFQIESDMLANLLPFRYLSSRLLRNAVTSSPAVDLSPRKTKQKIRELGLCNSYLRLSQTSGFIQIIAYLIEYLMKDRDVVSCLTEEISLASE